MSNYAIEVENLGKRYNIGRLQQNGTQDLRDVLTDIVKAPFKRAQALLGGDAYGALEATDTIWALKDVSFNVKHGEVVGIIGRNGAGKSTLLKILSRITEPTEGRIRLHGRVGALLEVGTGFHQDLTGRENVYLNGAILGMSREEIDRKFDEIVDFSGVEKFIDTPVKFYSSGMRLRLGFAVAAHLEPDILVVDEVLAVGDAEFQKKCLGKMEDVAGQGRTVLFVSHNMAAVQNLCTRAVLLNEGEIIANNDVRSVINTYLEKEQFASTTSARSVADIQRVHNHLDESAHIIELDILNEEGISTNVFGFGEDFTIKLVCKTYSPLQDISFLVGINSVFGDRILTVTSLEAEKLFSTMGDEIFEATLHIRNLLLKPNQYKLTVGLFSTNKGVDLLQDVVSISIDEAMKSDIYKNVNQVTIGYLQIPHPDWVLEKRDKEIVSNV